MRTKATTQIHSEQIEGPIYTSLRYMFHLNQFHGKYMPSTLQAASDVKLV